MYTLLVETVLQFSFLSSKFRWVRDLQHFYFLWDYIPIFDGLKSKKEDRGLFLSLLLSLLYESTHNFLSVTFSSITGDNFVLQYYAHSFFVVTVLTYFIVLKIIHYFHLELTYFDKDYLYPFLKKVFFALLLLTCCIFRFQIW